MEFSKFEERFQKNFAELTANATHLYEVEVDKDEMWNLYLDSFPAGTNEITEHEENTIAVVADTLLSLSAMWL